MTNVHIQVLAHSLRTLPKVISVQSSTLVMFYTINMNWMHIDPHIFKKVFLFAQKQCIYIMNIYI